jgi:large-conductance mechanosensitive channel
MATIRRVTSGFFTDVNEFGSTFNTLTLAAFATIFTWGFVQALKRTLLTPLISAYMIPSEAEDRALNVPLRKNQTLLLSEFLAELIQFMVFMLLIFLIWRITKVADPDANKN